MMGGAKFKTLKNLFNAKRISGSIKNPEKPKKCHLFDKKYYFI
jgi:hypothetical protein